MCHVCTASQTQTQLIGTLTRSRIIGQHAVRQTTQNGDNYLKDDHLIDAAWIVPNRRPVGDRVMPRHSTHANDITTRVLMVASDAALFVFLLCALNILLVKADGGSGMGELRGWPAVLFPCQFRLGNRNMQIVRLWSASVHGVWSKIHVCSPQQ